MSTRIFETIEEKLDFLDYRQDLLFENRDSDRMLFESEITRAESISLMDLMDAYSEKIFRGEHVSNVDFESDVYDIIPSVNGDYHFCKGIVMCFRDERRWPEVFDNLYGVNR